MQDYLSSRFPDVADPFAGLVYLGNDLNDLSLMRRAGYAVAPADAHPKVLEVAHLVLDRPGGEGCVRSFVERLLGIGELSPAQIDDLMGSGA